MNSIIERAIECYGQTTQTIVAIEELSELQKELCKVLRSIRTGEGYGKSRMVEEVADVTIMLWQVEEMYKLDREEINGVINYKLERLKKRLEEMEREDAES